MGILKCLARLRTIEGRKEAAKDLAQFLHADDLIIFLKDPQLCIYLPAPGFPQVLKNGKEWRAFLNDCSRPNIGSIAHPDQESLKKVVAIYSQQSVAVLIGGNPDVEEAYKVLQILPLLEALFFKEQVEIANQGIMQVASQAAGKAEKLAAALDLARKDVVKALAENNRLIKTLQKQNETLSTTNSDLDNFIYTASHDLKAPVSNIEGLVNVLNEVLAPLEHKEAEMILGLIESSIHKFKETIEDLTEISKIQREVQDVEQVNVNTILEDINSLLSRDFSETGAFLDLDIKVPILSFSRKNLRSILYNLISNAIKYRHPNRTPHIKISTQNDGEFVKIIVQDNGLGLSKSSIPKLFTMFKRFHNHVEGSGIGLYIIKRIIENAHGKIEVESKEGEGTCFSVFLRK